MSRALTLALSLFSATALAQTPPQNATYFELLGNGLAYSVNYERRATERIWLRGGAGYWTIGSDSDGYDEEERVIVVPLMVNHLRGARNHKFELGGGVLLWHSEGERTSFFGGPTEEINENSAFLTGVIGYRYQRPTRGWIFRTGVTPFLAFDELGDFEDDTFGAIVGLSLGRSF